MATSTKHPASEPHLQAAAHHAALGRLLRLIATGRVDPTPLATHRFKSGEVGAGVSAGI